MKFRPCTEADPGLYQGHGDMWEAGGPNRPHSAKREQRKEEEGREGGGKRGKRGDGERGGLAFEKRETGGRRDGSRNT